MKKSFFFYIIYLLLTNWLNHGFLLEMHNLLAITSVSAMFVEMKDSNVAD